MLAFVLCLQMMEFYERVSGARMHAAYIRPGGVAQVTKQFMAEKEIHISFIHLTQPKVNY